MAVRNNRGSGPNISAELVLSEIPMSYNTKLVLRKIKCEHGEYLEIRKHFFSTRVDTWLPDKGVWIPLEVAKPLALALAVTLDVKGYSAEDVISLRNILPLLATSPGKWKVEVLPATFELTEEQERMVQQYIEEQTT